MKNKIKALALSLLTTCVISLAFILVMFVPQITYIYMVVAVGFLIYQGYCYWLNKISNKTNSLKIITMKKNAENLTKEVQDYIDSFPVEYCASLKHAMFKGFRVVTAKDTTLEDYQKGYYETYNHILGLIYKSFLGGYALEFWKHNNFDQLEVGEVVVRFINRRLLTEI